MKDANSSGSAEARLRRAADEVLNKLVSMDQAAFDDFIDSHMDGDIAQLLLYGNAFSPTEFSSCCQFNERIASWRFAKSVQRDQKTTEAVTLRGIIGRKNSTQAGTSYSLNQTEQDAYSCAA
jgi:predicted outer membrane protein